MPILVGGRLKNPPLHICHMLYQVLGVCLCQLRLCAHETWNYSSFRSPSVQRLMKKYLVGHFTATSNHWWLNIGTWYHLRWAGILISAGVACFCSKLGCMIAWIITLFTMDCCPNLELEQPPPPSPMSTKKQNWMSQDRRLLWDCFVMAKADTQNLKHCLG